jgi:hypothetical protein
MFFDLSMDNNEENFDDILENEECQQKNMVESSSDMLNRWYADTVLKYDKSGKTIDKSSLSEKEIHFIGNHSIVSAIEVVYGLLEKYTSMLCEDQISLAKELLGFISKARVPKELAGGFLILMIKYHFLP